MRMGSTLRVLRVFSLIYRAGVQGVTAQHVLRELRAYGYDIGLRTVQRDLTALVNDLGFCCERANDPGEHDRSKILYYIDRTGLEWQLDACADIRDWNPLGVES